MNKSKADLNKSESESNDKKRKTNIREIYLQALNNNKDFKSTNNSKKKSFTNLTNEEKSANIGASNYLEKEFNLVKRILSDTKELKKIKKKINTDGNKNENMNQILGDNAIPSGLEKLKPAEEYYQQVFELKKRLKMYQNNELIYKAKFEYYENEMDRKEQEIMELLNIKKAEEIRLTADSNTDLPTLIYGLKQKCFKLEFSLRRKENELNKLKTEIKTTNLKELKCQNERLRVELSKALLSDKDIPLEERISSRNGKSPNNSEEIVIELRNKVKDLHEENEYLIKENQKKIEENKKLVKEIDRLSLNLDFKNRSGSRQSINRSLISNRDHSISDTESDKKSASVRSDNKTKAAEFLQTVFRGHLQRTHNLNRTNEEDKETPRRNQLSNRSPSNHSLTMTPDLSSRRTPTPREIRGRRDNSIQRRPQQVELTPPSSERSVFTDDDDEPTEQKRLIENKKVKEVDNVSCCGSLRASACSKSDK